MKAVVSNILLVTLLGNLTVGLSCEPKTDLAVEKKNIKDNKPKIFMKITDWADGAPVSILTAQGASTLPTRVATFRMENSFREPVDIQIIAFKDPVSNIAWVGPLFSQYALVGNAFFGFQRPNAFGGLSFGYTNLFQTKVGADVTVENICALYDKQGFPTQADDLYQTVNIKLILGVEFFEGYVSSAVGGTPAKLTDATINGIELTLKLEGYKPTETAEIVLSGRTPKIGVLRASIKGQGVPIIYAQSSGLR